MTKKRIKSTAKDIQFQSTNWGSHRHYHNGLTKSVDGHWKGKKWVQGPRATRFSTDTKPKSVALWKHLASGLTASSKPKDARGWIKLG